MIAFYAWLYVYLKFRMVGSHWKGTLTRGGVTSVFLLTMFPPSRLASCSLPVRQSGWSVRLSASQLFCQSTCLPVRQSGNMYVSIDRVSSPWMEYLFTRHALDPKSRLSRTKDKCLKINSRHEKWFLIYPRLQTPDLVSEHNVCLELKVSSINALPVTETMRQTLFSPDWLSTRVIFPLSLIVSPTTSLSNIRHYIVQSFSFNRDARGEKILLVILSKTLFFFWR